MYLVIPLILVAAAAAFGYSYGRDTEKYNQGASDVTNKAKGWLGTAKGWLRIGKSKKELARFRDWIAGLPGVDKDFVAWLEGLSAEDAKTFVRAVSDFGSSLNVERAWLLDGRMDDDPELDKGVRDAMSLYCMAYWKATQVQDEVEIFAVFQEWQAAPHKRKHRELTQKLFARLVEDALISMPPELHLASRKKRQNYAVRAIRDFAAKDRAAFNAVLAQVLAGPSSAPEPIEEPPAPKKKRGRKPAAQPETAEAAA